MVTMKSLDDTSHRTMDMVLLTLPETTCVVLHDTPVVVFGRSRGCGGRCGPYHTPREHVNQCSRSSSQYRSDIVWCRAVSLATRPMQLFSSKSIDVPP